MNREQEQFFTQCAPRYPDVMQALITFRAQLHEICKDVLTKHLREFSTVSGVPLKSLELAGCGAPKQIPLEPRSEFWAGVELKQKNGNRDTLVWLYVLYFRERPDRPFDVSVVYQIRPNHRDRAKRMEFNRDLGRLVDKKFRRGEWQYYEERNTPCFALEIDPKDLSNLNKHMIRLCRIAVKVLRLVHVSKFF